MTLYSMPKEGIQLIDAHEHNLKHLSLTIPWYHMTVITGPSGSGKSSLAFATLYAEGQRRYLESLSHYARQFLDKMPKPRLGLLEHIPPAIALRQHNTIMNTRSTVASYTETLQYLKVLFAHLGELYCPKCKIKIEKHTPLTIFEDILKLYSETVAPIAVVAPYGAVSDEAAIVEAQKVLLSTGYARVIVTIEHEHHMVLLEDLVDLWKNTSMKAWGELYTVLDRFKVSHDVALHSRLLLALENAWKEGQGKLGIWEIEASRLCLKSNELQCSNCNSFFRNLTENDFNYHNAQGACGACKGLGSLWILDPHKMVPSPEKSLKQGAIALFQYPFLQAWNNAMLLFAHRHHIPVDVPYGSLSAEQQGMLWEGEKKFYQGIQGCYAYLRKKSYKMHIKILLRKFEMQQTCLVCQGSRLQATAACVQVDGVTLPEIFGMSFEALLEKLSSLQSTALSVQEALAQLRRRLQYLVQVGVGYICLDRLTRSLSGGEFQRISLACQLGSGLCGTLYVLDEPSIGLHAYDTNRLLEVLTKLKEQGNTVVLVEHDLEVLQHADFMIELGPEAGAQGGHIVAAGVTGDVLASGVGWTSKYAQKHLVLERGYKALASKKVFSFKGCVGNNLKRFDVSFVYQQFNTVTGLSGSGKSTLVHDVVVPSLKNRLNGGPGQVSCDQALDCEGFEMVVVLDQNPLSGNHRSNALTSLKIWDDVRDIFVEQPLAKKKKFAKKHFSFNVVGGRCDTCEGSGFVTVDLNFMGTMSSECEVCHGVRFKPEVCEVLYRGKSIADILALTIDEAIGVFYEYPKIVKKLDVLRQVGLGYLQCGQSTAILSGGESQRLKIAQHLVEKKLRNALIVLDEPTTGLHLKDIQRCLEVFDMLLRQGHTLIVIEHNLDLIALSDWVVDLGPYGGEKGGSLLFEGTVQGLIAERRSLTGQMLKKRTFG